MGRKPIILSRHAVALIQIYKKTDDLEDIIFEDYLKREQDIGDIWENAAEQFISQLKKQCSPHFFRALKAKIEEILQGE